MATKVTDFPVVKLDLHCQSFLQNCFCLALATLGDWTQVVPIETICGASLVVKASKLFAATVIFVKKTSPMYSSLYSSL
jgi:hypothetical protein